MKARASLFFAKTLLSFVLASPAYSEEHLPRVLTQPNDQEQSCQEILVPMQGLNVSKMKSDYSFVYDFEIPGLHFLAEVSSGPRFRELKLLRFMLDYDPKAISRLSPYRTVLGDQPMQYSEADLRYFGLAYVAGYGPSLEFYLRLPNDPEKFKDSGPLLHLALESGQLYGYEPGIDVDGEFEGMLRGSLKAFAKFAAGVTTEIRFMYRNSRPDSGGMFYVRTEKVSLKANMPSPPYPAHD